MKNQLTPVGYLYGESRKEVAGYREFNAELLAFAYAQTTVHVYPNNHARIRKQLFGYTQNRDSFWIGAASIC